jgi:hypothetical protein
MEVIIMEVIITEVIITFLHKFNIGSNVCAKYLPILAFYKVTLCALIQLMICKSQQSNLHMRWNFHPRSRASNIL